MTGLPLNIDWQQILLHLFNFTILFGALYILLYKPVKDFMSRRTAYYAEMDSKAEDALKEAESSRDAYDEKIKAFDDEVRAERAKVGQEMAALRDKELAQAKAKLKKKRSYMNSDTNKLAARIYSAVSPNKDQFARFEKFIKNKYGGDTELEWIESDAFPGGFRLEVGSDVYDWSVGGRFRQLRDTLVKVPTTNGNIIPLLRETIQSWTPEAMAEQVGEVKTVGDGIATVSGLDSVMMRMYPKDPASEGQAKLPEFLSEKVSLAELLMLLVFQLMVRARSRHPATCL